MENEHGDLWELQLVGVRQTDTDRIKTDSRKHASSCNVELNTTLSTGSTLSLGLLTTDAYKRTADEPKTARAVQQSSSVRILGRDRELGA